ncbi:MAG: hypothetical protein IKD10_04895 [Lentisphaeria bacterium]|nr:hypothetical protein [Lentisphaeria bacterium]
MKKLLLWAALCACSWAAFAANNGVVAVGKASGKVVIDGKLDDPAWQNSISLTPFILQKQNRFATEQTVAKLLWDEENLYVAFRCYDRALDPVNNRMPDFKAAVRNNDTDKIFNDDCVILILLRNGRSYEFAINANGAVVDAAGEAKSIWKSRDHRWNSNIQVKIDRFERTALANWSVEAAIPWSSLGGKPQSSDQWGLVTGRFQKGAKETSSFQIISEGMHAASTAGKLKFIKQIIPCCEPQKVPLFTPGKNIWDFKTSGKDFLQITGKVKFDRQKVQYCRTRGKKALLQLPVELAGNGEFAFSWSVEDPASFTEYLRSPEYKFRVSASMLKHNFKNSALLVNGVKAGATAVLSSGLNSLELKGPANGGTITVGEQKITLPDNGKLNLLLEDSMIWPNWLAEGVYINKGAIQQILFIPQGVKGFTLNDYTINFDLPEGFELPGASGYYKKWQLECKKSGVVEYGKQKYNRYAITVKNQVRHNTKLRKHEFIAVLVKAPEEFSAPETMLYYHVSSAQANIREMPIPVKVKLLEKLNGKQPENLLIELWTGWLGSLDDAELYRHFGDLFKAAGVNETNGLNNRYPGIRHFRLISFQDWNFPCADYLAKHPEHKMVQVYSKVSSPMVCSTALVKEPEFEKFFRDRLPAWHKKWNHPHNIHWDYEHRVFETYLACFCDRCLKDFQAFAKLADKPTAELIKKSYSKEWTRYMNLRMAEVSALFHRSIKAVLPGVDYSIYSAYQSESSKFYYGLDWNLLHGNVGIASCGYSRNVPELEATRKAVKTTPLMLGELIYPYRETERMAPQFASAANLMRRACDATKGILIYEYPTLDGRSFEAMADVSRIMSDYEEFFVTGDRCSDRIAIKGFDQADYEILRNKKGDLLVIVMNPAQGDRKFSFTLKGDQPKSITDAQTSQAVNGKTVSGTIKATKFRAFAVKY